MLVAKLIDLENKRWDLEKVEERITLEEYNAIKAVTIPLEEKVDEQIWPFTRNGKYVVKSGYHYSRVYEERVIMGKASTSENINERIWKSIWWIDAAPKVVNFLRKV